jgi:protease IV
MSAEADLLADRRRLRRKLTLWRGLAALGVIGAIVAGGFLLGGKELIASTSGPHIARVTISGVISGDKRTLDMLKNVAESKASAVIVTVNSPGGTTTGSEALYDAIRVIAEKKPVAAVIDGTAASGGYIAALGTDRILARQTSLVGSIGVLFQFPNVSGLMNTVGVKLEEIKSSPLKAAPNGFEPTSPEARAALQKVVDDNYDWFKKLVKDRRKLSDGELAVVSDGRVHSGRMAVTLRLIDGIGGEKEAIAWFESEKAVAKDLPVRDWRRSGEANAMGLWSAASKVARAMGLEPLARILVIAGEQPDGLSLDGPLALWQPQLDNPR